jgi:hypothetical protein
MRKKNENLYHDQTHTTFSKKHMMFWMTWAQASHVDSDKAGETWCILINIWCPNSPVMFSFILL